MVENDCIFCKIIEGKVPSKKIIENDSALAFLDIAPLNKGHALIIPKKHFENIDDIQEEDLREVIALTKKVAEAVKKAVNADGINLYQCNGSTAGQVVMHFHMHVIPRFEGDGLGFTWNTKEFSEEETEKLLENIKKEL